MQRKTLISAKKKAMAKLGKWIGGFLGLMTGGPLGALAGFVLGSIFDSNIDTFNSSESERATREQVYEGERNTFRFSLLVLASYIIKADGKIMHSEMNVVRNWLRTNFGEVAVTEGEQILLRLFEEQKRLGAAEYKSAVRSSCIQLMQHMSYEQRLQLLSFLVMIAQADGVVTQMEIVAIRECAGWLGVDDVDIESMLNLKNAGTSLEAAYKVLGVSASSSNEEVKAAYRKLALKNHPDRVASLGEDVRKAAEKKLQEINAAKETIWKARGL